MTTVLWLFLLVAIVAMFGVAAVINRRRSHISFEARRAAELEQTRARSKWAGSSGTKGPTGGHLTMACRVPGCTSIWYTPPHESGTAAGRS